MCDDEAENEEGRPMNSFDLRQYELTAKKSTAISRPVHCTSTRSVTTEEATIAENGALVAYSGEKTGRSPKDKRIVKNPTSEK